MLLGQRDNPHARRIRWPPTVPCGPQRRCVSASAPTYVVNVPADRRPALSNILRSMLVTYSQLLDSLLAPPPTASATAPPEWQKQVEWITTLSQNIMAAANDLRPVQARGNLELMMQRQLELRREETKAIHACVCSCSPIGLALNDQCDSLRKCDELEARLAAMRGTVQKVSQAKASPAASLQPAVSTVTERKLCLCHCY